MKIIFKINKKSFLFLNITQFLGALNDNVFKLLIVFLLIHMKGPGVASIVLSLAGAIFVIPFLLFSAAAGVLADRLSKRNVLVSMKVAEILIMLLSTVAIFFRSEIGVYLLLFLMATQSAIFSPSKYGIIPEIVPENKVSKANGILTSLTYLAIIIGTFFAAFITDITHKNFVLSSTFCIALAVVGFLASLRIIKTSAKKSRKKINVRFIYEIYKTLKLSYKRKFLLPSIFGSAFFLFIGGFVQLNTIPFAMQSLSLTEVGGGYLFLSTAIGIAIGTLIAGKLSKGSIHIALACVSGFITAFLLMSLWLFATHFILVVLILILLGIFGGMFLIPFDAFIQIKSPEQRRGQIIAAAGFLSFLGVLIASFLLFFLSEICHLSAATGFFILGALMLLFNFINTGRLSEFFLPYITKNVLQHFYTLQFKKLPPKHSVILIEDFSWSKAFTLFAEIETLKIIALGKKFRNFPFYNGLTDCLYILSESKYPMSRLKTLSEKLSSKNITICLVSKQPWNIQDLKEVFKNRNLFCLQTEKSYQTKRFLGFKKKQTIYKGTFQKI